MSPLEVDAAFADLFTLTDELKRENATLSSGLQTQRENVLRLQEQVAALQAEDAKEELAPVVNVTSPDVVVNLPPQPVPVIQNNVVLPAAKDKKLRVSYTDYQGAKKIMEIESINE